MLQLESNGAGLEQRIVNLQAQIDALRRSLPDDGLPPDQRLVTLTDHGASLLKHWAATADRHARVVSQLEAQVRELSDTGTRLQQDTATRLQDLERIIQHEWTALRDLHEAPVRQLAEQAASLTEVCVATANAAQQGFDRAEARLTALEGEFHRATAELAREVHAMLAEVRQLSSARPLAGDPQAAWPLEGVTRLHQQLRESSLPEAPLASGRAPLAIPSAVPPVSAAGTPLHSEDTGPRLPDPPRRTLSRGLVAALVAVMLVGGGAFTWVVRREVRAAADQAEQSRLEARRAADAAAKNAAERQQEAERQLAAAHDLAARAQTIGDVLAATDLIRYTLAGTAALPGASGQVLWSRSRGFVFSAAGIPAPPPGTTYQVWLLTRGGAVSAATFVPDAAGQATVTASVTVPRPVYGAVVTTESSGGAAAPTGGPVLARVPVAVPQS